MKLSHFLIVSVGGAMALIAVVAEYTRPAQLAASRPVVVVTNPHIVAPTHPDVMVMESMFASGVAPIPPMTMPPVAVEKKHAMPPAAVAKKHAPVKVATKPHKIIVARAPIKQRRVVAKSAPASAPTQVAAKPSHLSLKQKLGKLWIGLKSKFKRKPDYS
jgi:hypothetical protein